MSDGAASDILPFRATEVTLGNGLRVIVVPTGFPNLVSLQISVQTGSRNEVEPGKSGFAHFFEHMMFRGTERYPSDRYREIVARTGARQNAYTSDDYTNYHLTFAAEDLEQMLEVEADRFMSLSYPEEDFRTEARAILGEYNKNAANPLQKLFEVQHDRAFSTHTYKHTVMGFLADIEDMPNQFEYSRVFFDRWYRPEYTSIIIAGDLPAERVVEMVERHWGRWQRGTFSLHVPAEPPSNAPAVAHVAWPAPTLPWVTVGFHGPAFSESEPDYAAVDVLFDLQFGRTSDLYRRLVEQEQVVDQLRPYVPPTQDPSLVTVMARLKRPGDAAYVRDAILETVAASRREAVAAKRLQEAKSNARYAFARTLDNSESIAETLAAFVRVRRSYDTLNALYRRYDALMPGDLQASAVRYLSDENLVLTTLSHEALASEVGGPPPLASFTQKRSGAAPELLLQPSPSPLLRIKFLFEVGSAHDPPGRQGLAQLAASMVADAGSKQMRIDEIHRALFPMAGSFHAQVDREMTVFTGIVHRDNADRFADIALGQLLEPGLRDDDFARVKAKQLNTLVQDLRTNNEEELAKERLQANLFAGGPYGHTTLGTVAGIEAITLDDVRDCIGRAYTLASLTPALAGDAPPAFEARLRTELAGLPPGQRIDPPPVAPRRPRGLEVEIIEKETRAVAISLGHPIGVTRTHPDFAALWLARAWLGEHREQHGRLFQRIRELRGMNYGDYAYIEAFPGGMFQFFPDANRARRAQLFEIWVRPVPPEQAVFALKLALFELQRFVEHGLSPDDFETTRSYLMKNVFVMTKTQDQQLGYALDSRWFGTGEFTATMREAMSKLTVAGVNDAVRRHISATDLSIVMVAPDAAALREQLLSGEPATIAYDAPKPQEVLGEDRIVGARPLVLTPEAVRVTDVTEVFARADGAI